MDVSIIIVNYNTGRMTEECIQSIFEHTYEVEFEVILVDNASTDNSKTLFEENKRIHYVYSDKNLGFGKANNLGFQQAKGKYIFCLNSDTLLLNNAVSLFFNKMEDMPDNVACMGTLLLNKGNSACNSYFRMPRLQDLPKLQRKYRTSIVHDYNHDLNSHKGDTLFEVENILGADMFIRCSAIKQCGFFDPDFFLNYEEAEMQHRLRKSGLHIYIYSEPQIIHLDGASKQKTTFSIKPSVWQRLKYIDKPHRLYYKKTNRVLPYYFYYTAFTIIAKTQIIHSLIWGKLRKKSQ